MTHHEGCQVIAEPIRSWILTTPSQVDQSDIDHSQRYERKRRKGNK